MRHLAWRGLAADQSPKRSLQPAPRTRLGVAAPVSRVPVVPRVAMPAPHEWDRKRGACRVYAWLDEYLLALIHCRVANSGVWCQ